MRRLAGAHVARQQGSGGHSDAHGERLPALLAARGVGGFHRLDAPQACSHRLLGVVFALQGHSPGRHQMVSQVLHHHPLGPEHDIHQAIEQIVEEGDPLLRLGFGPHGFETHHVDHQHRTVVAAPGGIGLELPGHDHFRHLR